MNDSLVIPLYLRLTPRQRQVTHLVSEGLTNQEVADILYIESGSVADQLTTIYGEMGTLDAFQDRKVTRPILIRVFGGFVERHPEFNPFVDGQGASSNAKA